MNPGTRFQVSHQNSQFCPILACFVGYCSPFWSIGAISTVHEPRYTLPGRSSKLVVWSDSSLFWGTGAISTVHEPRYTLPGRSSELAFLSDSILFRGLFAHRFGLLEQFPRFMNPGTCFRDGHQNSLFWPILACFHGLLLTVLGSWNHFHGS